MTRDEVIAMAREASAGTSWKPGLGNEHVVAFMERFAALIAAAEREACAQIAEMAHPDDWPFIGAAIRSRSTP